MESQPLVASMPVWQQISCEDMLASLDALKELVTAPSAEDAPF